MLPPIQAGSDAARCCDARGRALGDPRRRARGKILRRVAVGARLSCALTEEASPGLGVPCARCRALLVALPTAQLSSGAAGCPISRDCVVEQPPGHRAHPQVGFRVPCAGPTPRRPRGDASPGVVHPGIPARALWIAWLPISFGGLTASCSDGRGGAPQILRRATTRPRPPPEPREIITRIAAGAPCMRGRAL